MAWRNWQYGTLHVGRDDSTAAWSVVDSTGTTITTGDNSDGILAGVLGSAYDSRAGSAMEWAAANRLRLDRSANPGSTSDLLFVPGGHNLTAAEVYSRPTPTGTATSRGSWSGTEGDPFTVSLSAIERYLDLDVTPASGNARIGEAVYTDLTTPTIGPEAGWDDSLDLVAQRSVLESGGSAIVQKGTSQRVTELTYPHVTAAADVTIFAAVEATAGEPFLLLPAYDDDNPRWVFLDGNPRRIEQSTRTRSQGLPAGQSTLVPGYRFRLREQTL